MSYKKPKKVAYVVFVGRIIGIHESWDECHASVNGYPGSKFKGYTVFEDAIAAWEAFEQEGKVDTRHGQGMMRKRRRNPSPDRTRNKAVETIDAYARKLVAEFSGPDGSGSHSNA